MASKNSVITRLRRINLAKVTSGEITAIPKVTSVALGDGGLDDSGDVKAPSETQTTLNNEVGRYTVTVPTFPTDTTARYTITVPESDLVGKAISEMALVDASGELCAIRNTMPKVKDSDEEFSFIFDDEF